MKKQVIKYSYIVATIAFLLSFNNGTANAQKTIVKGKVTDLSNKEPLPFVNIIFLKSNIGTVTNEDGSYLLESSKYYDSVSVTCFGYVTQKFKVKKAVTQEIDIALVPVDYTLSTVTVVPGENPAHPIFRKIIENKEINNPEKLEFFHCELYNKLQIDLNNITDKLKSRKAFNKFQFVFELQDSSEEMGKTYLPVFLSENYSQYYYQRRPERKKEIVMASKISGVENKSYAEFTGQMYIDVNFYQNYVDIFGKQCVSPFSNSGLFVYKYWLIDSSFVDNEWCYHISFKPKRKQESTFFGDFWVNDTTWAIKKLNVRLSEDVNINYVKDLIVNQEYTNFGDTVWFKTKDEMFADLNIADKAQGLFARKLTVYKNLKLDKPVDENFFSSTQIEESIVADSVHNTNSEEWNNLRPEKLSQEQEKIYETVDSIKNVPLFRTVTDMIYTVAYGYYVYKDFEFGPYFKTYSFNPTEGNRFRVGGRTSNAFSTKIMLSGFLAYGTKDQKFKYGGGILYMFKKNPRHALELFYENDLYLLGQSVNAFSEDNILASILAVRPNDNLLPLERYRITYEKEWFTGLLTTLRLFYGTILPSEKIPFHSSTLNQSYSELNTAEISLITRFAYNEKVLRGEFERVSLGSVYPILNLELTSGLKGVWGSNFNYFRARLNITDWINTEPFGYVKYALSVGKIWGKVPFPLLVLHEGNETYALDQEAYNLMNYYEFASDFYQSVYLEQHFQGFFLNRIPLLRKLKWREVLYGKMVNGSIRTSNENVWDFPQSLMEIKTPYVEAGVGIENIFKIIRIDAIWRLSNLSNPDIQKFGIRAKLQFIF